MADIITTKDVLQNVFGFEDEDTRTVNLLNPVDSITADAVQAWADYAKDHNLIIGDKAGAALTGILSSNRIENKQTRLDLS